MSISGLTNSALDSLLAAAQSTQNGQGGLQQIEAEFQQLGQDLQTGNLTEAQEDYTTAGNWPGPPASPSRPRRGQARQSSLASPQRPVDRSAIRQLGRGPIRVRHAHADLAAAGRRWKFRFDQRCEFVFVAKQRKQRERLGLNLDRAAQKIPAQKQKAPARFSSSRGFVLS